ncbi:MULTISPECIES: hypothetical protein [unclassified Micromonospora]|uniref:hypothetical protein n=1 Tax=unclassified Micromonospora TaxID=2617518 RepID=UPI001C21091A|nr:MULTISPECIES: hypothetical protein [unclassified Micromonospora]MBU8857410.1 hypothetical protein [Micromonospora sp. WMMB482]MDM4783034.1 hypothetical protein [Micromonospora sp. b486]
MIDESNGHHPCGSNVAHPGSDLRFALGHLSVDLRAPDGMQGEALTRFWAGVDQGQPAVDKAFAARQNLFHRLVLLYEPGEAWQCDCVGTGATELKEIPGIPGSTFHWRRELKVETPQLAAV